MKTTSPWPPAWGSVRPPFWRSSVMEREGAMFIRMAAAAMADAPLLFEADEIREVRMADGNTIFEEGRDYVLAPDHRAILAYGMNDIAQTPPDLFRGRMQTMIERVRSARPDAEVVLVAPMMGNPLWECTPAERFPVFRDILASLTGPGVALADLTQLWMDLLRRKRYLDLSGNGLNHPNDFGHRLYAQVLLHLLI